MKETDLFYVQRWSDILNDWDSGVQALTFELATRYLREYKASELKRIVRYCFTDETYARREHLLTVWQGKKVPEWLGGLVRSNV